MSYIKTPVKGMRDCLPADMQLREYVIDMIRSTYLKYGFSEIETPAIEHIENLSNKQGGENEKLIFKILKRGRDLEQALLVQKYAELSDCGLRYDLTVPLARYYANNAEKLTFPFKALQIGSVWRADKPQKGRFRQFTQCDIDILGESTILAEIELISATANMLSKIFSEVGISKFTVHVNDRNILKSMAGYAGFKESDIDNNFIILDKFDKIGIDGIRSELEKSDYESKAIETYIAILNSITTNVSCKEFCQFLAGQYLTNNIIDDIDTIIDSVKSIIPADINVIFDPTLVRGMSYYTGTIFECSIDGYGFSIAGGGRYDKMIGKYCGKEVCACGFSIGFERIITILQDNFDSFNSLKKNKKAILIEPNLPVNQMSELLIEANNMRENGTIVTIQTMKKNLTFQLKQLELDGYNEIEKIYSKP